MNAFSHAITVPQDRSQIENFLAWLFQNGIDFRCSDDRVMLPSTVAALRASLYRFA